MASNFLQWNPAQNNQKTDNQYSIDTMRTGGAVTGVFAKELANKLFYQVTTMVSAIGTMMSNKGYTISDSDLAILITAMSNILTKADFGSSAGTVCEGNDSRFFASTTKVWFYQNVAPTGWTIDATAVDAVLAVKGSSGTYAVSGGTQAGTWTQPGHVHTTGDHALTISEMPSHNHFFTRIYAYGVSGSYGTFVDTNSPNQATSNTGGDQTHNHGDTGSSGTLNTWRPLAQVGIICVKN